jgi:hypothetical protein
MGATEIFLFISNDLQLIPQPIHQGVCAAFMITHQLIAEIAAPLAVLK